ncbi:MAG: DUF3179 domain-containing protein [Chloroflexota bacterium]
MTRLIRLAMALALVATACGPGRATTSPGGDQVAPSGSPVAGASGSVLPDLGALRVSTEAWRTDFTRTNVDLGDFLSGGPGKDGIPAIDNPVFESIEAARIWLGDRSPVISFDIGGQARAYPLAVLIWHEIVNDTVGGVPVVVTFCPLCNTALVFKRELDGVIHDFGTTGNLRYSDLVMYDRQTESWWQQATGGAIVGQLTGAQLEFIPAQIISLANFAAAHPDGTVLSRRTGYSRDYGQNPYVGYDTVDQNPFLFEGVVDGRIPPKERVVTIGEGAQALAFPFSELRKVGVGEAKLDAEPIVVFWMPGTASALNGPTIDTSDDIGSTGVFRPVAGGRQLTFRRDGPGEDARIVDIETGSVWSVTGRAIAGPLADAQLEPVVSGNHFWFAWAAFSPQTTIWQAP